jgi:bifunctional non-homologous end joining protein LigD
MQVPYETAAISSLKVASFLIDGEVVSCGEDGTASFARLRSRQHDGTAFLYAFDLLSIDGEDIRVTPL